MCILVVTFRSQGFPCAAVRQVTVVDNGQKVEWLNELEWVGGEIWANIWQVGILSSPSAIIDSPHTRFCA